MSQIRIEVRGAEKVGEYLNKITGWTRDFSNIWQEVVIPMLERYEQQLFSTEGASGLTKWAPLSARYAAAKARTPGTLQGILVRYGDLRASLAGTNTYSVREVKPQSLTFGSTLCYAGRYGATLAEGWMSTGGRFVPPRKAMSLTNEQKREITNAVRNQFIRRMNRGRAGSLTVTTGMVK